MCGKRRSETHSAVFRTDSCFGGQDGVGAVTLRTMPNVIVCAENVFVCLEMAGNGGRNLHLNRSENRLYLEEYVECDADLLGADYIATLRSSPISRHRFLCCLFSLFCLHSSAVGF